MKVFIDAGHGGKDSGAVYKDIKEKDLNLQVALFLMAILEALGFTVKLSRDTDIYLSLAQRSKMANEWGADFIISVHHNSYKATAKFMGCEVIHSLFSTKGKQLAKLIVMEFVEVGMKIHGGAMTREGKYGRDYYHMNRRTKGVAVITEFGFIDSKDYELFNTHSKLFTEAECIARGLCNLVDIKYNYARPEASEKDKYLRPTTGKVNPTEY